MAAVGYLAYEAGTRSIEAEWLAAQLGVEVRQIPAPQVAEPRTAGSATRRGPVVAAPDGWPEVEAIVAEGIQGLAAVAALRAAGFRGPAAVLPYVNPVRAGDLVALSAYRRAADPQDRVFVGSRASASVFASFGVEVTVAEPFGVDDEVFRLRPQHHRVRSELGLPPGDILLFAGRLQPDKDIYRLLRVALRARVLFPTLLIVLAGHVRDDQYLAPASELGPASGVHLVRPSREQLADLYAEASVFVTASTSGYETFGRAPIEAMACGTPAVAPRYGGFPEVLDQPGGWVVDVAADGDGIPRVREEHLLRTIYDVLSSPTPPAAERVSAAALARHGRSRTLTVLNYLAGGRPPPVSPVPPAQLDLPAAGRSGRTEEELATAVRVALWRAAGAGDPAEREAVMACR